MLKAFASRPQDWIDVEKVIIRQGERLDRTLILEELAPLSELKEEPEILEHVERLFDSTKHTFGSNEAPTRRKTETNCMQLIIELPSREEQIDLPAIIESEPTLKKKLYFEAGAEEAWFCQLDGQMEFYTATEPAVPTASSTRCPDFPSSIS